jgi:hypothetical protein
MKTPKFLTRIALCLLAAVAVPATALGAESTSVTGILILASNDAGDTDSRLKSYEPTLRRLFKFRGYKQVGRSRTSIEVPGKGVLNFGNEKLVIETTGNGKGSVRAKVQWRRGNRTMINTTVRMQPGVPTLLGGPKQDGGNGNLIVILVAN